MVDWKPDSEPILFNGMGTPYLAICNGQGKAIMDKKNNLPIGMLMTSFEYVYDEEDSNHGQFVLQTDNPDLAGLSDLGYYAPLMLQWGWIYPEQGMYRCGPIRKVLVSAKEVIFNENGTQITIEFGDYSYLLKNQPANYYQNPRGFAEYMKMMCRGSMVDVMLADYKQKNINQKVVLQKVESNSELASHAQDDTNQNQNLFLMPGGFNQNDTPQAYLNTKVNIKGYNGTAPEGFYVVAKYKKSTDALKPVDDSYEISWEREVEPDSELITAYLPETLATCNVIIGNQLNKLGQLKEIAWVLKNGPWFVDSVDDTIFIHNQNVNGAVTKVYTYAGGNGELLSFTVKSDFVKKQVQVGAASDIDEDKNLKTDVNLTTGGEEKVNPRDQVYAFNTGYYQNPWLATSVNKEGDQYFIPPTGTFDQNPDNYIEVEEDFDPKAYEADPEEPVFSSVTEAKNKMMEAGYNLRLTKEEVISYYKDRLADFQEVIQPLTEASDEVLDHRLHQYKSLSQLVVKRKAKIRGVVDANLFALSDRCTEEMKNKYLSGDIDLFNNNFVPIGDTAKVRPGELAEDGINNLQAMGFTVTTNSAELRELRNPANKPLMGPDPMVSANAYETFYETPVIVEFEAEISIPIDGINILNGYPLEWAAEACMPQLEEHTQHSAEATAIVVGDPSIVSSTNMQIQNVSQAYSGIWYIKKVTHRISPGAGYKCEIEFVHRVQDTVTNHTEYSMTVQEFVGTLLPVAQEAAKTESWKNQGRLVDKVKNMYEEMDDDQSLITVVRDSEFQDGSGVSVQADSYVLSGEVSATQIKTNQIYEENLQDILNRNGGNTGLNNESLGDYTIDFPEDME